MSSGERQLCGPSMSVDAFITKSAGIEISEWVGYVNGDAELCPDELVGAPDQTTSRRTAYVRVVWNGHSSQEEVWVEFLNRGLALRNPDEETISKFRVVAARLGATLVLEDCG